MANVILDYAKGDTMICLIDGKFSQHKFTGNASIVIKDGGNNIYITYEIDIPHPEYPTISQRVDSEFCFHTIEEAMEKTGLLNLKSEAQSE